MTYPKISIITPNYNGGEFLEETIVSILSQNYPNLEYIIIDGGSSDNSVEIIKKYESQLAFWVSEPDKGLYDAIQKGFDKSTGEIMAWLNSDDMYHKNALFTVAEIFNNFEQVQWLQGIPTTFDEKGRTVDVVPYKRWSKLDYYLGKFEWIQQESTFWTRKLWEKENSKIDLEMKYAGDLDLWLRFFRHEQLYTTTALLGGFRQRSGNQLSLNFIDEYIIEAKNKISLEINNIPNNEREALSDIKNFTEKINTSSNRISYYLNKRKYSKKIEHLKSKYFPVPPRISFDRLEQKFKIQ